MGPPQHGGTPCLGCFRRLYQEDTTWRGLPQRWELRFEHRNISGEVIFKCAFSELVLQGNTRNNKRAFLSFSFFVGRGEGQGRPMLLWRLPFGMHFLPQNAVGAKPGPVGFPLVSLGPKRTQRGIRPASSHLRHRTSTLSYVQPAEIPGRRRVDPAKGTLLNSSSD